MVTAGEAFVAAVKVSDKGQPLQAREGTHHADRARQQRTRPVRPDRHPCANVTCAPSHIAFDPTRDEPSSEDAADSEAFQNTDAAPSARSRKTWSVTVRGQARASVGP